MANPNTHASEMYDRHEAGESYASLAREFGKKTANVKAIVENEGHRRAFEVNEHPIAQACRKMGYDRYMYTRIFCALARTGAFQSGSWMQMTEDEVLETRNLGANAAEVILLAQDISRGKAGDLA